MRVARCIGVVAICFVWACTGQVSEPGGTYVEPDPWMRGPDGASPADQAPSSALRRLSRVEYENTLSDVFGVAGLAETYLPPDVLSPYDTDSELKVASAVFVEGLESLAFNLARDASADTAWVDAMSRCTPTGADDATCLRAFASELGRRTWRRLLSDAELDSIIAPALMFAAETNDFYVAARFVIQSLINSPQFAYRPEIGVDEAGLRRLDNYEVVTRLSYLIWGTTPDPMLLDRAEGELMTSEDVAALATTMLGDPRADTQITRFHQLWFGYNSLRVPMELEAPMLAETDALLNRVLVEERASWSQLFTSTSTFVDPMLAGHYGMADGSDGWVDYEHPQRAGILSHGSFLSLSSRNVDDTSPTIRGKFVATRLLCWTVPDPPDDVDVDDPPEATDEMCKSEAYAVHRDQSSACFGCHKLMDPIGFGLERFDGLGRYREVEWGNASCNIDGEGELEGVGTFNGPRELVDLMTAGDDLTACGVRQFLHFATGREQTIDDEMLVGRLHTRFVDAEEQFREIILGLASDPVFLYRVEAP